MNILFDYQAFCRNSYGGVSRYYAEIIKFLIEKNLNIEVLAPIHRNNYINDFNIVSGVFINKYPRYTTSIFLKLNFILSNLLCNFKRHDILHETYYNFNPISNAKVKVLTVYDCTHELLNFSANSNELICKSKSIKRADHIICISHNTKNDLINFYDVDDSKISVTHCGVSESTVYSNYNSIIYPDINLNKKFILFVGTRFEYKKFHTLIDALSIDNKILDDFDVVLFGGGPLSDHEKLYISDRKLNLSNFIQLSGDDSLLSYLYNNASVLAYTSQFEGFGFPPVDAMRNFCPVIVSNSSCLPEVGGDGVSYYSPNEADSLLCALKMNLYDETYRSEMANKGYLQSLKYSWENCADQTFAVYKKLL